jgi:23S rRNA (pseudouridine1915-N3)-methyltransferase
VRLSIVAVGRLRRGPEAALTADYAARINAAGRAQALGPLNVVEIDDRKHGVAAAQAEEMRRRAAGSLLVALDERGDSLDSRAFARRIAEWRDAGVPAAAFAIGGADGHDPALLDNADWRLSLGPMVWPHMLARVMLAEQLYRAVSILSGAPYHRG